MLGSACSQSEKVSECLRLHLHSQLLLRHERHRFLESKVDQSSELTHQLTLNDNDNETKKQTYASVVFVHCCQVISDQWVQRVRKNTY